LIPDFPAERTSIRVSWILEKVRYYLTGLTLQDSDTISIFHGEYPPNIGNRAYNENNVEIGNLGFK